VVYRKNGNAYAPRLKAIAGQMSISATQTSAKTETVGSAAQEIEFEYEQYCGGHESSVALQLNERVARSRLSEVLLNAIWRNRVTSRSRIA
jgi:hypothetical protein